MKKTFLFIVICLFLFILVSPTTSITATYTSDMSSSFNIHILTQPLPSERGIEYDSLYYIRDDDPNHIMDEESLLRNPPMDQELICCGLYVILRFAENIQPQADLVITNIYYHLWQKAPELPFEGEEFEWDTVHHLNIMRI
ncbi:MAG: hypothetical protein KKC68_04205 [Candidatus Thermoplasmatota archaeon]|nr:hypothetical protein [Candidatus Thermoplasmatota archaeon]MBU1940954.1 hypothetical protein [Candidatus Thermoplasmatota archaeon]